ncbi:MAG TPA: glycosyltransferase [Balneolaceae bacterium]|nr:glycosyltransferase [Balneolaceae bacterium]
MDYTTLIVSYLKRKTGWKNLQEAQQAFWRERPFVSIIIPGRDEGENYYQLVSSLSEQTYQNFEIIIIDDGSDDYTPIVGRQLERSGRISMFLRNEERGGKASAANLALQYCKGEYVIHLDADCSFNRDAIEQILIPFYENDKIGAVGGNLQVRNDTESLCTTLQAIEYLIYIFVGRTVASSLGILRIVSGAFGAFRIEVLDRIKGWDVGPGLDGDLTLKIRKLGYKVHFEPNAVALTHAPETFKKLAKQRIRWSRSLVRFRMRKHSSLLKPTKNFNLLNFLTVAENILFDVVLNVMWYIYMIDIAIHFSASIGYVIVAGFVLYMASKMLEFIVVVLFSDTRWDKFKYIPYLPAMVLYTGYYIRIIRTWAYIKEYFFRSSYKDPWNPLKTSAEALRLEKDNF